MAKHLEDHYITVIPNSGHRVGHKLDDLITGFILAEWYGFQYLHSPLPDGRWEEFFGFGEGEVTFSEEFRKDLPILSCTPFLGIRRLSPRFRSLLKTIELIEFRAHFLLKKSPIKVIKQWRRPDFWDGSPLGYFMEVLNHNVGQKGAILCFQKGVRVMLYQVHRWGKQGKIDPGIYHRVVQKLRERYFAKEHPKKVSYFSADVINIAVHIRRDDASMENQRFLPLSYYQSLLQKLDILLQDYPHEFHVYSLGSDEEMEQIKTSLDTVSSHVKYHLNESGMEAIHHMAIADVLLVGNSSFSHWPGFLSRGIKIYNPHFHMYDLDENEWIVADSDGNFDDSQFKSLAFDSSNGLQLPATFQKTEA